MKTNGPVEVPGCRGTTVQQLAKEDGIQILRVDVERGGEIPMHSHACAATMIILKGSAVALGKANRQVQKGDIVVKKPNEPHGFIQVKEPFSFISISDNAGILRADGWDMDYE